MKSLILLAGAAALSVSAALVTSTAAGAALPPGLGHQESGTGLYITTGPGAQAAQLGLSHTSDGTLIGGGSTTSVYDWFAVIPGSSYPANQTKYAEEAPKGHDTGYFLTETARASNGRPGTVALVHGESLAAQWTFDGSGHWVNGKYPTDALAVTTSEDPIVTLPAGTGGARTVFTFTADPAG